MNIAFSTIILFFLILPGLAFRRFYYTGEFSKQYFRSTGFEIVFLSIVPSLIIHFLGYNILPGFTPISINLLITEFQIPTVNVDLSTLLKLFTGIYNDKQGEELYSEISKFFNLILIYNLILTVFGSASGYFMKIIIRRLKLDRKIKLLRFQNEWHYIISSEILDFPKVKQRGTFRRNGNRLKAVWVDALINIDESEGAIIYTGIIEDYKLSKEGGLELLYLTQSYRRFIKDDKVAEIFNTENEEKEKIKESSVKNPYYYMPEHYFILKYDQIKNLNIFYEFEERTSINFQDVFQVILGILLIFLVGYFWYWITGNILVSILLSIISFYVLDRFLPDEEDVESEAINDQKKEK